MHEHAWHDEPISVKLFFPVLLLKMQVCVSVKANKNDSQHLIIKCELMIALHGYVSQMCCESMNVADVCDQHWVIGGRWDEAEVVTSAHASLIQILYACLACCYKKFYLSTVTTDGPEEATLVNMLKDILLKSAGSHIWVHWCSVSMWTISLIDRSEWCLQLIAPVVWKGHKSPNYVGRFMNRYFGGDISK